MSSPRVDIVLSGAGNPLLKVGTSLPASSNFCPDYGTILPPICSNLISTSLIWSSFIPVSSLPLPTPLHQTSLSIASSLTASSHGITISPPPRRRHRDLGQTSNDAKAKKNLGLDWLQRSRHSSFYDAESQLDFFIWHHPLPGMVADPTSPSPECPIFIGLVLVCETLPLLRPLLLPANTYFVFPLLPAPVLALILVEQPALLVPLAHSILLTPHPLLHPLPFHDKLPVLSPSVWNIFAQSGKDDETFSPLELRLPSPLPPIATVQTSSEKL
ncbi:hypothetical protein AX14_012653 [Amanita brunnescens Koide BX004]|nr:hypothetical protein AX14_012653 [Amanita brunnescens Koide BX004]